MPIEPIPIPPRDEIYQLYVVQGLTKYGLHKHYGISNGTAEKWVLKYGLDEDKALYQREQARVLEQSNDDFVEGEYAIDYESNIDPEVKRGDLTTTEAGLLSPQLAPLVSASQPNQPDYLTTENEDDNSAFAALSTRKKMAVVKLASFDEADLKKTFKEHAEEIGITEKTLLEWRKEPLFQQAFEEISMPTGKNEALFLIQRELIQLLRSGKATKDDRRLIAEWAGLTNGTVTAVQVNIIAKDPNLRNRF